MVKFNKIVDVGDFNISAFVTGKSDQNNYKSA